MITLKETNSDGVSREVVFSDRRECADLLRQMFGADALQGEREHVRNQTNSALRKAWQAKQADPSLIFRHGDNS